MVVLVGAAIMWAFNELFDPVPVAAAPAFLLAGLLVLWRGWPGFIPLTLSAAVGAVAGVIIHANWHVSGYSPSPTEGLLVHLVWEGLQGYAAALLAMLPSAVLLLRKQS